MNISKPYASEYQREKKTVYHEVYFPTTDSPRYQDNKGAVIYVRNNVVDMITTVIDLNLSEFLSYFGKPSQIWLYGIGTPDTGPQHFDIMLMYTDQGIIGRPIGFGDLRKEEENNILRICPEEINSKSIYLILWDPAERRSFDEIDRLTDPGGARYLVDYELIENSTDIDVEDFYITFQDPNANVCLETPMELWY